MATDVSLDGRDHEEGVDSRSGRTPPCENATPPSPPKPKRNPPPPPPPKKPSFGYDDDGRIVKTPDSAQVCSPRSMDGTSDLAGTTFELENGTRGFISSELKSSFRDIIETHIPHSFGENIAEDIVGTILLKSGLPDDVNESIWEDSCEILSPEVEPPPEGYLPEIVLLIVLHLVQTKSDLSISQMRDRFNGPRKKPKRISIKRSSFALVRSRTISSSSLSISSDPRSIHGSPVTIPSPCEAGETLPVSRNASSTSSRRQADLTSVIEDQEVYHGLCLSIPDGPEMVIPDGLEVVNPDELTLTTPHEVGINSAGMLYTMGPEGEKMAEKTAIATDSQKAREAPEDGALWDCPVCMTPQPADNQQFNDHVDYCLSRQTIESTVKENPQVDSDAQNEEVYPPLPEKLVTPSISDGLELVQADCGASGSLPMYQTMPISDGPMADGLEVASPSPFGFENLQPSLQVNTSISSSNELPFVPPTPLISQQNRQIEHAPIDGKLRLAELIKKHSIQTSPTVEPIFEAPAAADIQPVTKNDDDEARHLLFGLRISHPGYRESSASLKAVFKSKQTVAEKSKPENFVYSPKELNAALGVAVHRGLRRTVVESLINMGANVNLTREATTNVVKKVRGKDTNDQRSDYIQTAAANRRTDIVYLLALRGADSLGLAEALNEATQRRFPETVGILLKSNADPNAMGGKIIQSAVHSGRTDLVSMMLRAPVRPSMGHITNNLPRAVETGNVELVSLMVQFGANVAHETALALKKAVLSGKPDMLLAVINGRPSTESLSEVMAFVFDESADKTSVKEKHALSEILLCAGAEGDQCAAALIKAVRARYFDIVAMMLSHRVSVDFEDAKALNIAVSAGDVDMVCLLLQGQIDDRYPSLVLRSIPMAAPHSIIHDLMALLLNAGAKGDPLATALVNCVHRKHLEATSLLIDYKASVDWNDAQALQMAVGSGDVQMTEILLKGRPSRKHLSIALPLIPRTSKILKLTLTKLLLRSGATGNAVSAALIEAVSDNRELQDTKLITALIDSGADPNYLEGKSLHIAARSGDLHILEILLRGKPSVVSLSTSITFAIDLDEAETRMKMVKFLLDAGAQGVPVAQALVNAVEQGTSRLELITLLVESGADVDFDCGKPLKRSMQTCPATVASLLIHVGKPNIASSSSALSAAFECGVIDRAKKGEMLLEHGVEQIAIDGALIQELRMGVFANEGIIRMLMSYHADVNFQKGVAVQLSAQRGQVRILELLVAGAPNTKTLRSSIPFAMEVEDAGLNFKAAQILLQKLAQKAPEALASIREIHAALVTSVKKGAPSHALMALLLDHGADPSWNDGEAIQHATCSASIKSLEILLAKGPPRNTLAKSVPLAMSITDPHSRYQAVRSLLVAGANDVSIDEALLKAVQEQSVDKKLLVVLLEHGADVNYQEGECVTCATRRGDNDTLDLLIHASPTPKTVLLAFDAAMHPDQGVAWKGESGIVTARTILESRPTKKRKAQALIEVSERSKAPAAKALIDLLIDFGTSVDYHDGRALRVAAERCDFSLVETLLKANPTEHTMSMVFPYVFMAKADEETLMRMVNLFLKHETPPNVYFAHPCLQSPLVLALTCHRNVKRLVGLLLEAGCVADGVFPFAIKHTANEELVTPLLWLLLKPDRLRQNRSLLTALIRAGANVNYRTAESGKCPIILAAENHDRDVVGELLDHDVDVSAEDGHGRTALSYAAERGSFDSMELLVRAQAQCNDQSIHYASRGFHTRCVKLLIDNGADPDFPSAQADGLTALGAVCAKGSCTRENISSLKGTLRVLLDAQADTTTILNHKSVLHLALDNSRPVEMTRALLESGLRKQVNDPCNLYRAPDGLCYSLTKYVEYGVSKSGPQFAKELIRMLTVFGCKDRYYNDAGGQQPPRYCGLPQHILDEMKRREAQLMREAAEERQREVERQQEEAQRRQYEVERQRQRSEEAAVERDRQRRLELINREKELLLMKSRIPQQRYG